MNLSTINNIPEQNDTKNNSIDEKLNSLEERISEYMVTTKEWAYMYKTEKLNNETMYIPYIAWVKFPSIKTQKEMIDIFKAVEKLNNIVKEVFIDNGENDDFYTWIENEKLKDLFIDNRFWDGNIFDTKVLSQEAIKWLIPWKNTLFYNNFLDSFKELLNTDNHIYIKNLKN